MEKKHLKNTVPYQLGMWIESYQLSVSLRLYCINEEGGVSTDT